MKQEGGETGVEGQKKREDRARSQRSRSREKVRSRSKHRHKKHKHKTSAQRKERRTHDRPSEKHYDRYYDRHPDKYYDKHHDKHRNRHNDASQEKGLSKVSQGVSKVPQSEGVNNIPQYEGLQANEMPMPPIEVQAPVLPLHERRRQARSRSPLGYYRRNQTNNESEFWDSFSWIPRINYTSQVSSSALVNTKKMRRFMITNIPFEIGITEDDLRELITRYMKENYLKDEMNNCPVVNMEIKEGDRNVAVELSSVEETCRICKLDKIELFKSIQNGIIRLGDSCYGNNVVTQAQTAAQAQAAAFAAINVLENKKTNFSMDAALGKGPQTSTVVRVVNAVTPYMANHLGEEQWLEYHEDLLQGFSEFGTIVHEWFVRKEQKDICADPGNLFLQYETLPMAEKAMAQMQGRIFDERPVCLHYIPREMYYIHFKKGVFPSVKPKEKTLLPQLKEQTKTIISDSLLNEIKSILPELPQLSSPK